MLLLSGSTKEAMKSGLSDMDYLRSKVAKTDDTMGDSEEEDDGEEGGDEEEESAPVQHTDSAYESGDRENTSKNKTSVSSEDKKQKKGKKSAKEEVTVRTNVLVEPYCTHYYSSHLCLFVADGAGDRVHSEAERSPVQC